MFNNLGNLCSSKFDFIETLARSSNLSEGKEKQTSACNGNSFKWFVAMGLHLSIQYNLSSDVERMSSIDCTEKQAMSS